MSKLLLEDTKKIKVLMSQIKGFEQTINEIINNKNVAEHSRYVSFRDMAQLYNDFSEEVKKVLKVPTMIYTFNVDKMPGFTNSLIGQQKNILEQVLVCSKILFASLEGSLDFVDDEYDNLENFIKSRLRTTIFELPTKEIQIQNAIETLLVGRGMNRGLDYDRESGKFEFSGKEYIPDFIIPKLNLCIEVKLLRKGYKSRIVDEISADITAYSKEYERQIYVVYDLGVIQNEFEFRKDIENSGSIKVIIVKH